MINIVYYEKRNTQMIGLANRVGQDLNQSLAKMGRATLAVPGGNTPLPFNPMHVHYAE